MFFLYELFASSIRRHLIFVSTFFEKDFFKLDFLINIYFQAHRSLTLCLKLCRCRTIERVRTELSLDLN